MQRYSEEEIAAEEERIGARLPDELRRRYLEGVPDEVVLKDRDGTGGAFQVWGPSTTATDKKGRRWPTPGMAEETDEVRQTGEGFLDDDILVAWGSEDNGDLAVVRRDGTLGWWTLRGGEIDPVEVLWDPSPADLSRVEAGEPL
jgi:hypothetical protein